MNLDIKPVVAEFEKDYPWIVEELKTLVRIPSVSFPGFDLKEVDRSAERVSALFKESGLENVQVVRVGQSLPYVLADWCHAPGKPTLLLYAHHDVQPPGRVDVWKTPPFEPTEKEGPGGLRLYGRGTSDDKAGIFVHLAAIRAYLKAHGKLPVNVKVVIEGEEEIGSGFLAEFLNTYKKQLQSDVLVLTDTMNFDIGVPSLTTSLRGLVDFELEIRATDRVLHSGLFGGLVPDPAMGLSRLLASLVDEEGNLAIPEIVNDVAPIASQELELYRSLAFDKEAFRKQSGLVDSSKVLGGTENPWVTLWRKTSLTVNALQSSSRAQAGNTINDTAWAKVSLRIPPGMDAQKAWKRLRAEIEKRVPWGLELQIKERAIGEPWLTEPFSQSNAKAFEAAQRALERGYGKKSVFVGIGASIPFVRPFSDALNGAPPLLIGVEDPYTSAHGENESMHLGDFKKACLSQVYLFEELAKLG